MKNEINALMVCGDGTRDEILKEASLPEHDVVVATTNSTEKNLLICMKAKKTSVTKVIARVTEIQFAEVFQDLEIEAVTPEASAAEDMAAMIERPGVERLVKLGKGAGNLLEMRVKPDAKNAHKQISQIALPEDCILSGIFRGTEFIVPRGSTVIMPEDLIVVVGTSKGVQRAEEAINEGK